MTDLEIGKLYRARVSLGLLYDNGANRNDYIPIHAGEIAMYLGYKTNPYITIHKFLYGETIVHWNRSLGFEDFALRDWLIKV